MNEPVIIGNATAIYALCDYPSMAPRYVGKTVQYLHERHKAHIRAAKAGKRLPVHYWLRKQLANGKRLVISLIEYAGQDWAERERFWIAEYRRQGHRLLNLTDGGEGLSGHVFSQTHRERISAALKTGAEFACEQCSTMFWRKQGDIQKGNCRFCSRSCYAASLKGISRPVPESCTSRGIAAAAVEKRSRTHCKRGHALSGQNLFITSAGSRGCKECRKIHKRTYLDRVNV